MAHFLLFGFSFPFYFLYALRSPACAPAEAFCAPIVPVFIMLGLMPGGVARVGARPHTKPGGVLGMAKRQNNACF